MVAYRYRESVMTHMIVCAVVICAGIALATWGGWISIAWPDVLAVIIWVTGITMLTGISLMTRSHTTIEP